MPQIAGPNDVPFNPIIDLDCLEAAVEQCLSQCFRSQDNKAQLFTNHNQASTTLTYSPYLIAEFLPLTATLPISPLSFDEFALKNVVDPAVLDDFKKSYLKDPLLALVFCSKQPNLNVPCVVGYTFEVSTLLRPQPFYLHVVGINTVREQNTIKIEVPVGWLRSWFWNSPQYTFEEYIKYVAKCQDINHLVPLDYAELEPTIVKSPLNAGESTTKSLRRITSSQ